MTGRSLRARLGRTFFLQAVFIGLAAVVGVFLAEALLEDVLIRQALRDEAAYFWDRRAADPSFPLPATRNLTGFMGDVPDALARLDDGFHDLEDAAVHGLVLVTSAGRERLYLVFDGARVEQLAFYFGLAPLALALLVLYLSTWLGFRASRRAFSPVIALAREVRQLDLKSPDPARFAPDRLPEGADEEVQDLASAISKFAHRLTAFVDREQHFTRDASHELRSPLTVIRMAADLLAGSENLSDADRKTLERITRSARDMEELIGAFLLLARETDAGLPVDRLTVNEVVREELERARQLAADKPVETAVDEQCGLVIDAPEKVLSVLIGNLLRNAVSYTDAGTVVARIVPGHVIIEDSGVGIPKDRLSRIYQPFERGERSGRGGHGVGLTIVRRLSDRFGWPVTIDSTPGVGTRVDIAFPQAQVVSLARRETEA